MEKNILRRVQLEQLEILEEIHRICIDNDIQYFLDAGTLIGAVRHKGFIPWDDDIDIGMLRKDYEKFSNIASNMLGKDYVWQSWRNNSSYALPFGKVRKKNTVYIEEKSNLIDECGFYVDVFPFDYAPDNDSDRERIEKKCVFWERCLLMKHKYRPWLINGKIDLKKRMGYIIYQFVSLFFSHNKIVEKYESEVFSVHDSKTVYANAGTTNTHYFEKKWLSEVKEGLFEGKNFYIPNGTHERLFEEYGDYMKLPPENMRENRHSILRIVFSNGEEYENV